MLEALQQDWNSLGDGEQGFFIGLFCLGLFVTLVLLFEIANKRTR